MEDAPLYSFNNWYIGPTRGATMDFRTLLHKIHMGKELTNASSYAVNGIFLGVAYPVHVDEIGFPNMPGGVNDCTTCHGQSNTAWRGPAGRNHPDATIAPVRTWRAVCGSCHDSDAVQAHTSIMTTPDGVESCETCHGASAEWSVQRMHKVY